MKLLMATAEYLPARGGTAIHTHEVAVRLAQAGVEVTVAATSPRAPFAREAQDGPVRVRCVRSWPSERDWYIAPRLARLISRSGSDLVHLQGYHTAVAPVVMLAALRARIPYVVTLHSGGSSSKLRRALRPVQARVLRPLLVRARRIIAVSPFEAELFAQRMRLPLSAFTVIPSGADLPDVPRRRASGSPLILSIGRVESYKGHQRVVEALPALNRVRPGTCLRIAGSGPYEEELRRLAERLGVADLLEIRAVPAHRRDEMAALMQRSWAVAALSQYESQGLAVHEALALGRPLVISNGSALNQLRGHANVRTVSDDADGDGVAAAILELLDAPPAVPPPLPTWDQCVGTLIDLYEETLAESR